MSQDEDGCDIGCRPVERSLFLALCLKHIFKFAENSAVPHYHTAFKELMLFSLGLMQDCLIVNSVGVWQWLMINDNKK